MYGEMGRIGLIVLDSDLTIEPDLRRLLPEGVEIHAARVVYPRRVTADNLAVASERAIAAVEQLLPVRPAAIAWACTSASFSEGRAGNERLVARLQAAAGAVPVTTASGAVVAALARLGLRRPMVGSPYSEPINRRLLSFLREHGLEPTGVRGLHEGELDDFALQDVDDSRLARFLEELAAADGDSIVLSCTGLGTARIAPKLEHRLGKPILTSNLAILWRCWELGRIAVPPAGDCRLLRTLQETVH